MWHGVRLGTFDRKFVAAVSTIGIYCFVAFTFNFVVSDLYANRELAALMVFLKGWVLTLWFLAMAWCYRVGASQMDPEKILALLVKSGVLGFVFALLVLGISIGYFEKDLTPGAPTASSSAEKATAEDAMANSIYRHVHAIAYVPETRTLLLGTHYGLFKSTDGGAKFVKASPKGYFPSDDVMAFAINPTNRLTVYAAGHDLGVVKSTDGGESWVKSDEGIQGKDIHGFTMNQRAPNYLYAFSVGYGLFRSTDGGATWNRMDDGPQNPSVRSLAYMAVQTDIDKNMKSDNWGLLFAGTGEGLYQSFSCFCGWVKSSRDISTTIYSLSTPNSDLTTMYAATKDGLWKSTKEGTSWVRLDGMTNGRRFTAIAIDPSDVKHLFAATEDGVVFESVDAGGTFMLK